MVVIAAFIGASGLGYRLILGGYYSALPTLAFLVFVGLAGWWDRAMITAYMVVFATFICDGAA